MELVGGINCDDMENCEQTSHGGGFQLPRGKGNSSDVERETRSGLLADYGQEIQLAREIVHLQVSLFLIKYSIRALLLYINVERSILMAFSRASLPLAN